ncbi:hypothetical protein C8R46DRAFT_1283423 [Mycena filopes]|nr:hypothetical protein C8R46DRAFT_1283423 [Mycena filopes]
MPQNPNPNRTDVRGAISRSGLPGTMNHGILCSSERGGDSRRARCAVLGISVKRCLSNPNDKSGLRSVEDKAALRSDIDPQGSQRSAVACRNILTLRASTDNVPSRTHQLIENRGVKVNLDGRTGSLTPVWACRCILNTQHAREIDGPSTTVETQPSLGSLAPSDVSAWRSGVHHFRGRIASALIRGRGRRSYRRRCQPNGYTFEGQTGIESNPKEFSAGEILGWDRGVRRRSAEGLDLSPRTRHSRIDTGFGQGWDGSGVCNAANPGLACVAVKVSGRPRPTNCSLQWSTASFPGKKEDITVYRSSSRVERNIGGQRPGDRQMRDVARARSRMNGGKLTGKDSSTAMDDRGFGQMSKETGTERTFPTDPRWYRLLSRRIPEGWIEQVQQEYVRLDRTGPSEMWANGNSIRMRRHTLEEGE